MRGQRASGIAVVMACWPLLALAAAAVPLDALDWPALPEAPARHAPPASGCSQAPLQLDRLPAPWPALGERLTRRCSGPDGGGQRTILRLKPGAATLAGLPVLQVELYRSALGREWRYRLAAPFAAAARPLGDWLLQRCAHAGAGERCEPYVGADGRVYADIHDGGSGIVEPDPDDPQATLYSEVFVDDGAQPRPPVQ